MLRVGGGLVDFFRVVFQRREPALHVRRATAPVMADADPRAGQHRRQFGAEFFAGVLHATELSDAVLERVAVQPIGVAGGVAEFMERGLVVPVRRCELLTFRERHRVGLHVVEGAIAAFMADTHAALLDHALGGPMGFPFGLLVAVVVAPVELEAVGLLDVEHGVNARTGLRVVLLAAGRLARVGRAWRRLRLPLVVHRVKQDRRRLLAWADLTTQRLDLRGGRPAVVVVALRGVGDTQVQRVHAPVRVPAHEVFREPARAGRPRLLPRRHALRDLRLNGRDKRGVVVLQGPRGGLRRRCTPPGHQLPPFPRDGCRARRVRPFTGARSPSLYQANTPTMAHTKWRRKSQAVRESTKWSC